jgi:hypothetical protein
MVENCDFRGIDAKDTDRAKRRAPGEFLWLRLGLVV